VRGEAREEDCEPDQRGGGEAFADEREDPNDD
jgi:hypothetical protein